MVPQERPEPDGGGRRNTQDGASARDYLPEHLSLSSLRGAASACRGCPLWKSGTQTVFGEGLRRSRLMLVGEQPGDREDREGRPFVGPAGKMLDRVLADADIARDDAFVTNVVKHFKWVPRGGRRLHKKPNAREIRACLPWLEAEIEVVKPHVLLCLGSTAAQALLGSRFRVSARRGEWVSSSWAPHVAATIHPSAILRIPEDDLRREEYRRYVEDFRAISGVLSEPDGRDGGA